jgi:hypothetical protein
MPRTLITPINLRGSFEEVALTWTAMDPTNGNSCALSGKQCLLFRNEGVGSESVQLLSVDDPFGRRGDLTLTLAAGAYRIIGPMIMTGWKQTDGLLYLDPSSSDMNVAVLNLP